MPSLVTTQRKEAANALIQLANSNKPIIARYHLRNRSKLNHPTYIKTSQNATIEHIIAAATILDHQTRTLN